ncbi:hypothetical protein NOK12_09660 [Nocardioides sp. OK12]|uniref:hypothetical protein n=1 Tax=Nocardioides sp. OK12 TaxID=2758661 RepID=UPI0021C2A171|nr:hypothetical protein [Nocardioides sp. OK12]GHJ58447.1 hypothetical protein NOK12_09660 [Nocardioides sp. OK12]
MSQPLRDELERIADRAPVADVPADTWSRARRSVRRDTAAALAALVAVVALVAGAVAWLPDRDGIAPADGDASALPAYLPVPTGLERVHGTDDLAVGAQAVAMVPDTPQGNREVVVVDARSGEYRGLDLPGFGAATGRGLSGTVHPVTLSPAGTTLAYPRASGWRAGGTLRTGVGIVDLVTGDVRKIALEDEGRPVLLRTVTFSPDGRWLLWTGQPVRSSKDGRSFGSATAHGVVAPGATRSTPLPGRDRDLELSVGVDDQGTVARVGGSTRLLRASADEVPAATLGGLEGIVHSGSIDDLAVSSLVQTYRPRADPEYSFTWVTASRGEPEATPRRLDTPADLPLNSWWVLEWVDPDHAVVAVDVSGAEEEISPRQTQVGVVSLADDGARYDPVLTSDPGARALTVATDLLADGAAAVERPLPAFADDRRSRSWWYVGSVLLLVGALALAVVRRRRRSAQRPSAT